jgi:hypothetical protein
MATYNLTTKSAAVMCVGTDPCRPRPRKNWRRMIARIAIVILAVGCDGCTETIAMKNPTTGEVYTCGGHPLLLPIYAMVAKGHDEECVKDYKDQGFVRATTN